MERITGKVRITDELGLFLVVNELKPATHVLLHPQYLYGHISIPVTGASKIEQLNAVKIREEDKTAFESELERLELVYSVLKQTPPSVEKMVPHGVSVMVEHIHYAAAKNATTLSALVDAKTLADTCLALGCPPEIVDKYFRSDPTNFISQFKAVKAEEGVMWMAYLPPDLPKTINIDSGVPLLKQLGTRYQLFVRENNPCLAERLETAFYNSIRKPKTN